MNVDGVFTPKMKTALRQAGDAIRDCPEGDKLDRVALETLYDAFKTAAAHNTNQNTNVGFITDGGVLDMPLFGMIVRAVVGPVERRAIERLFKQFDDDGNGEIDFGEFIGSARALSRQVAAQEDFLSPDTEDAVSQAFELIDGDDRFPGDGMINMGQDLNLVLRCLSLETDDIELMRRFEAFIELELQKKTAPAEENNNMFFSGRTQRKIDGHWLKSYVNTLGMEEEDRSPEILQQAEDLADELEIPIQVVVKLLIPYQQDIDTIIPLLSQAFNTFDRDCSGSVDEAELKVVMASLGQKQTDAQVHDIFVSIDNDNSGDISFGEFVRFMADRSADGSSQVQLHGQINSILTLFSVMDKDKSGEFTVDEMMVAMRPVGAIASREELDKCYAEAGGQGDLGCFLAMASSEGCPKGLQTFVFRLRAVRELFSLFDENDGGFISVNELSAGLTKYLGWRPTRFESEKMLAMVDTGGDGKIDFSEFYEMMGIAAATDDDDFVMTKQVKTLQAIKHQLEAIQSMFTIFDTECDGLVDFHVAEQHMERVVSCLGETWPKDEIKQICTEISKGYEISKGCPAANFRNFCEVVVDTSKSKLVQKLLAHFKQIKQLFSQWDSDGSGDIDASELSRIIKMLGGYRDGDDKGEQEVAKLVDEADTDGDGEISFVEFVVLLSGDKTQTHYFVKQKIIQLREAFDMFDRSGNGAVNHDDFWRMAYLFGMTDPNRIEELLSFADTDGDGMIDFVEFVGMMTGSSTGAQVELRGHLAGFREAFTLFDADNVGFITAKQFQNAVLMLGYKMSVEQINELIAEHDDDNTGTLDFSEFVQMLANSSEVMGGKAGGSNVAAKVAHLRESFTIFDLDCDGVLSFREIKLALQKLNAFTSDADLWAMMAKVDDDCSGSLSFPEFASMVSLCKEQGDEDDEEKRRLELLAEEERNRPPFHTLRRALTIDPEKRPEKDIDTILQQVREQLNIRAFKDMDNEIARGVCREMRLVTMKEGDVLLTEGEELSNFYIILEGSVKVWNKTNGPRTVKELTANGGLWTVAEREFETIVIEVKQIKDAWPGGAQKDVSPECWSLVKKLERIHKDSLKLLAKGRACMKNDFDQVLRSQDTRPEFGSDGQDFVELLRNSFTLVGDVRREYLGHEAATMMSGSTHSIKAQIVNVILDLSVKLQAFLLDKIEQLAPIYKVDGENHGTKMQRTMSSIRGNWSNENLERTMSSQLKEIETGHLTAQVRGGNIIGSTIFEEGAHKSPVTCVCKVKQEVQRKRNRREKPKKRAKKQSQEKPESMQVVVVSRQTYQLARSEEPRRFIDELPYFPQLAKQTVAESFIARSLGMNNFLVKRGQAADFVYLVKSGQLTIQLQVNQPTRALTDGSSFTTSSKSEAAYLDAAILGPGDVIDESEILPDGTRVHTADIMASSSGVVVYSLPQAVFYRYAEFDDVAQHRNSRRKEFISQQTELQPVHRLDQNKISAVRNRRIVLQTSMAAPSRESMLERAQAVIDSRKNPTTNRMPQFNRKKLLAPIMPAGTDFRIVKSKANRQEKERGSGAVSCPIPVVRCASPTVARHLQDGYSFTARKLHRKPLFLRDAIHHTLAKKLEENKCLSILEQEDGRIHAQKLRALSEKIHGGSDEHKIKKRMLYSLHQTQEFVSESGQTGPPGHLPALCHPANPVNANEHNSSSMLSSAVTVPSAQAMRRKVSLEEAKMTQTLLMDGQRRRRVTISDYKIDAKPARQEEAGPTYVGTKQRNGERKPKVWSRTQFARTSVFGARFDRKRAASVKVHKSSTSRFRRPDSQEETLSCELSSGKI